MSKTDSTLEVNGKFKLFAEKFLDKDWSLKEKDLYLNIATLAWNTSLLKKPERILEIQRFISEQQCPSIQLGSDTFDTLELAVTLAHLKKALFPEIKDRVHFE